MIQSERKDSQWALNRTVIHSCRDRLWCAGEEENDIDECHE
jgi:hypothetical protein